MKKRTAFPPWRNQQTGANTCDSTVASCHCPPPPSWTVLYSVRQEGGGGGETESACREGTREIGPHPKPQNTMAIINLQGAGDV